MSQRVLILTDRAMERHPAPLGHIERPDRLAPTLAGAVEAAGAAGAQLEHRTPTAADDVAIGRVHDPEYLAALRAADGLVAQRGAGWLDPDTAMGPGSLHAARLAAGATIEAMRAAAAEEAQVAFAVVRPPGHHAAANRAAGFCLLNNVAIGVAALRAAGQAQRVAVVDWDVHHGDGTQELFETDPDLWYGSTHQWPFYPGTGSAQQRGSGPATGTKHNVPLPAGSDDDAFAAAWRDDLLPSLERFAPEAIVVSAGFDAHRDDPLGGLLVTDAGYQAVATALGRIAARLGLPGVALTLEGGYDLDALQASARASVSGLLKGFEER